MPGTARGHILAEGEATGHAHVIDDSVEMWKVDGALYLHNTHVVDLTHEEHDTVKVPPGIWQITPTFEYDYYNHIERELID